MSSWSSASPARKRFGDDDLIFIGTEAGFCSQFNNYLYSVVLAKKEKKTLFLFDKISPISLSYPILQNTFIMPPEVKPLTIIPPNAESVQRTHSKKIRHLLSYSSEEELRNTARSIFRFTPSMAEIVEKEIAKYSFPKFDVGVHIRSGDKITAGEMAAIPIERYIRELQNYKSGKPVVNVFVMTDNPSLLDGLRTDSGLQIYSLEHKSPCSGAHVQSEFNRSPRKTKEEAYIQFITELSILQKVPGVICTLSSNIGRFLYITREDVSKFKSLDVPVYTPG